MQNNKLYPVLIYIIIVVLSLLIIPNNFADDNTKVGLPEGAIARLGKGGINIIRFSPDGTYLAVGTDVGVWLYDVQDGTETALFSDHVGQVNALAFSQDGNLLASGGFNNPAIEVWKLDNKSNYATIELNQPTITLSALAFYGRILVGYSSREVIYWKVEDSRALSKIDFAADFLTVVFSRDGSNLAAIDKEEKIRLFDTRISSQYAMLPGHRGGRDSDIHALAFSPDNSMLLSGGEDRTVLIWDVQDQVRMKTLRGHNAWVTAVAWSEDGKTVASGDAVAFSTERVKSLVFSHDGTTLASGSNDGTVLLWDWDKIKNNIIANHKGEDLISVLLPVPEPITYASKTEEAKTVLKWLNDNRYQIKKLSLGYHLTHQKGSSTISNPDSGIIGIGDVRITIDKGVLKIRIEDIGSADFIFDEDDKLIQKVSIEQKTD